MYLLAEELRKRRAEVARLREQLAVARTECVRINKEQGQRLHDLLIDEKSKRMFSEKLGKMSVQRAIYEVCRPPVQGCQLESLHKLILILKVGSMGVLRVAEGWVSAGRGGRAGGACSCTRRAEHTMCMKRYF